MTDAGVMRVLGRLRGSLLAWQGVGRATLCWPVGAGGGVRRWFLAARRGCSWTFVTPAALAGPGCVLAFYEGVSEFVDVGRHGWGFVGNTFWRLA